ncbi:MAG: zinc-ribbon domain-containing protein [Anaerolineae bacterium]
MGHKLKAAQHCQNCGTKLTPGAKFCPECGEKV